MESTLMRDLCGFVFSTCVALSLLTIFEEPAKRGVFDQVGDSYLGTLFYSLSISKN